MQRKHIIGPIGVVLVVMGSWWAWKTDHASSRAHAEPVSPGLSAPHVSDAAPMASASSSGGTSLAGRLRAARAAGLPIADLLKQWLPHAGEDPELSMSLAMELMECTALAPQEEAFIDHDAAAMPGDERDSTARNLNRRARVCEGIDDGEQIRFDLVTAAANSGDVSAQTSYRFYAGPYVRAERSMARDGIRETYKHDAVRFAQSALASHTRTAYHNAYEIYSSDLYGAQDPVAAYAYLLMTTRGVDPSLANRMQTQGAASLTAEQLQQAQAMAGALTMAPEPELHF